MDVGLLGSDVLFSGVGTSRGGKVVSKMGFKKGESRTCPDRTYDWLEHFNNRLEK